MSTNPKVTPELVTDVIGRNILPDHKAVALEAIDSAYVKWHKDTKTTVLQASNIMLFVDFCDRSTPASSNSTVTALADTADTCNVLDLVLADRLVVGHQSSGGVDVADLLAMDDELFVFDRAV